MTATYNFVRAYERHRERRAPSGANDSNNGCNEFKQFRITECGVELLPSPPFSWGQNPPLSAFTQSVLPIIHTTNDRRTEMLQCYFIRWHGRK